MDIAIDTAVQYSKTKKNATFSISKVIHDGTDLLKYFHENSSSSLTKQTSSKWTSVKDIGVSSDPNKQWRSQMEVTYRKKKIPDKS